MTNDKGQMTNKGKSEIMRKLRNIICLLAVLVIAVIVGYVVYTCKQVF